MEEDFNEYMTYYKSLPLKEKQTIIIDQLKMLTTLTHKMCEEIGQDNEMILNTELSDLKDDNYTEDDFAEAVITLVNSVQNSICDFDLKLTEISERLQEN